MILTSIAASSEPGSDVAGVTLASPARCSVGSGGARGAGRAGLGVC
jgi:hypothetical protein